MRQPFIEKIANLMQTLIVFDRMREALKLKSKVERIIGGKVDVQPDMAQALFCCSTKHYDLVLLENCLPNITGYEFSSIIRSISHNIGLPIFVLDHA